MRAFLELLFVVCRGLEGALAALQLTCMRSSARARESPVQWEGGAASAIACWRCAAQQTCTSTLVRTYTRARMHAHAHAMQVYCTQNSTHPPLRSTSSRARARICRSWSGCRCVPAEAGSCCGARRAKTLLYVASSWWSHSRHSTTMPSCCRMRASPSSSGARAQPLPPHTLQKYTFPIEGSHSDPDSAQ